MASIDPLQMLSDVSRGPHCETVLLCTDSGSWSYAESCDRVRRLANGFAVAGLKRGDRIALCVDDYDVFFYSLLAAWRMGCTVAPINLSVPDEKLACIWTRLNPAAIVSPHARVDCPGVRIVAPTEIDVDTACEPLNLDDLALVTFTSGTTGTPKGVCQSLRSVWMNACLTAVACGFESSDRVFINTPPYYTSAMCHFLTMLACGAGTAARKGFLFGESLIESMLALGATGFGGAPAHAIRVAESGVTIPDTIRFWVSSGDTLPVHTQKRMCEAAPHLDILVMYGLTETAGRLCMMNAKRDPDTIGSVGLPLPGMQVSACDEQGQRLPAGDTGELYVQGPMVMPAYYDDPERTDAALTSMGFRTGDFGCVAADGRVRVQGRRDDMIKVGAEKVSLVEIQHVVLTLDGVIDVAAVAVEDEFMGCVCEAYVVSRPDAELNTRTVRDHVRKALPPSHCPRRVHFVERIPRSGAGKLLRQDIGKT